MSKLYFKYGVMGCSKTACALMCKFNYEQQGYKVLLLKSLIDTRNVKDNEIIVHSRIGLESKCTPFGKNDNLIELFKQKCAEQEYNVIMVDECQFATKEQIEQLKELSFNFIQLAYVKGNPQSKAFWEKNGFLPIGVEHTLPEYTKIVMQRKL